MERDGLDTFPPHPPLHISVRVDLWFWDAGKTRGLWCLRCLAGEERAAHSQVLPSSHHLFLQKGKAEVASWKHDLWEDLGVGLDDL